MRKSSGFIWKTLCRVGLVGGMLILGAGVLAEKPDWAGPPGGQGKHKNRDRSEGRGDSYGSYQSGSGVEIRIGGYFGDSQRMAVRNEYREQSRSGSCPPGLAKKNNGCMPPGQARKWVMGQPLPKDVVYYPIEPGISVRLGIPPAGHKFVRVAADILLIAVGTGMVIDAVQDIGR